MSVEDGEERTALRTKLREQFGEKSPGVYYFDPPSGERAGVAIRYRPPFIQTSRHDARQDAFSLALDHILSKEIPLWLALLMAREFVDAHAEDLMTGEVDYEEGVYETIDASVWCRQVMTRLDTFLREYAQRDCPLPEKPSGWEAVPYSVHAERNRRAKMEDKWCAWPSLLLVDPNKGASDVALFGVFDGHGGVECASYCATHIGNCVVRELQRSKEEEETKGSTLVEAIHHLDQRLSARCEKQHWSLDVAWVGDSAAYLVSPSLPEEAKRVEEDGGCLVWIQGELRVNGILNLTRSLGDIAGRPMISARPDVKSVELDGGEFLCVLTCDGVSDALNEEDLFHVVKDFCSSHTVSEYKRLSEAICAAAREGSSDNLTAVTVFLRPPQELWNTFAS